MNFNKTPNLISNRFLERCGKLFFLQMRPFFFFLFAALPLIAAAGFLFFQNGQLQEIEERFARASSKGKQAFERKAKKERFLQRYTHADPYFLDQQVETLSFLKTEKERLESLLSHPAMPRKELLQERLSFLMNGENRILFTEENLHASAQIKEADEKQRHPIQLDEADLQKILALIEDIPVGPFLPSDQSPQLLVREFRLKKQTTPLQTEVFEVEFDLLKREFIKP